MDPDRVRAYLQVACAGLGFDIGEIWWSQSQDGSGSSALMAIEEQHEDESSELVAADGKKLRFVQLYTSKSYEEKRNMLVKPANEEENYNDLVNGSKEPEKGDEESGDDNSKHVLSPLLVDAITKTAQVVWAHTRKQEGLLGRSDMRLQTAVGMPVAVDGDGNMCVVVMFSPNNIQSTDDAMDYLQSISRSATSNSIPSLLPAFDPSKGLVSLPHHHPSNESLPLLSAKCISDGVVTRFVSLDDAPIHDTLDSPEVHGDHDLSSAPKDCFGIPMLPHVSEFGGNVGVSDTSTDVFDEASYGVWSTVMDTIQHPSVSALADGELDDTALWMNACGTVPTQQTDTSPVYAINRPVMERDRRIRLEEFAAAFLDVSVFDLAEVWIPIGAQSEYLGQVTAVSSSEKNTSINEFKSQSEKILIKFWSGAVGRAFSSGNPVWSANREVFVDSGRASLFEKVNIETALAVPVFSGKSSIPSFVLCCYSFVRTGSVPFVLKFVQQALRLLWDGLDKVQPHESLGEDMWKDVAPADLGEMAADVEMQQHFIIKKRPHHAIASPQVRNKPKFTLDVEDEALARQLSELQAPTGTNQVRSIYTGSGSSPLTGPTEVDPNMEPNPFVSYNTIQSHIQDAVKSVGNAQPVHHHVSTNEQGTKRAHVYAPVEISQVQQPASYSTMPSHKPNEMPTSAANPTPLPMPRPLPLPTQLLVQPGSGTARAPASTPHAQPPNNFHSQNTGQIQNIQAPQQQPVYATGNASNQYQNQYQGHVNQLQNRASDVSQPEVQQKQPVFVQQQQHSQQQTSQGVYVQQQPYEPTSQTGQATQPAQNNQITYTPQQPLQHEIPVIYTQQNNDFLQPQQQQQPSDQNVYVQSQPQQQQQQQQQQPSAQNVYVQSRQQPVQSSYLQQQPALGSYVQHEQPPQHAYSQQQAPQEPQNGYSQQQVAQNGYAQHQTAQNGFSQPPQQPGQTVYVQQQTGQNGYIQQNQNQPQSQQTSPMLYPSQGTQPVQAQQGAQNFQQHPSSYVAQSSVDVTPVPSAVASIPTHQLSASGITLPVGSQATMAAQSSQYCLPVDQTDQVFADVSSNGKPCRIQGCNEMCAPRRPYCVRHSGNRMCEHEGCSKCAQGSTRFCIAHGGGRRCTYPGCDKGARDKFFCAAHGGGKRCKAEGCNKSAVGGSNLCTAHGGGRRCSVDGCDKSAQSSTKFCVKHGGGKKCLHPDCEKVSRGRTQYCAAHGGGVRCKLEGCNRVAIGKLQLCRAHGGGARPRGKKNASPPPSENAQPIVQQPQAQPNPQQPVGYTPMGGFGMDSRPI